MIDRRHFSALQTDEIEVTRSKGTRGADGFQESDTSTILLCKGNAQRIGREAAEMPASFSAGDIVFYAAESIDPVEVSDSATVTAEGREIQGTVEETSLDSNSLVISIDG